METETLADRPRGKYGTKRSPDRKPRQRVTLQETIDVWTLHAKGVSQSEIARATGLTVQQVNHRVLAYHSTESTALQVLKANAHRAADAWVQSFEPAKKRGEHRPMKDALIAIGVIAPDPEHQGVMIVVGSGDVAVTGISQSLKLPDVSIEAESRVLGKNEGNSLEVVGSESIPNPPKAL